MNRRLRAESLQLKSEFHNSGPVVNDDLLRGLRLLLRKQVRSNEDRDDILQEVMLKILQHGQQISPGKFVNWIVVVSRNTAIDYYRKQRRTVAPGESHFVDSSRGLDEIVAGPEPMSTELANCVQPMLKALSSQDAQILRMVEISGVSQVDAAKKMNLRYSTFKSKLQRARLKLKAALLNCCKQETSKKTSHPDADCCGCGDESGIGGDRERGPGCK